MTAAVHQVLATLGYGDAIGHEVLGIRRVLRGAGYRSEIFVQTADPRLESLTVDFRELPDASHPDNILIHHFSIGSRASRVAYALPDRMVLVYHNITPPEYFVDVNTELVKLCFLGRRELALYKDRCDLALGDSEYNRQELETIGFPVTAVLPVVPSFEHLGGPADYVHAREFDDEWVNVLFVGRVIPNKRFEDVIRFFHAYRRWFNPRSRLLLVGSYAGFERYLAMLHRFVEAIGASDVHFLGHVSNEELTAYYELADVFLSASEHEGFCVPLVEAFHMGVPVIAYAATAVPATLDGAGLLYTARDPLHVAALISAVVEDRDLRARVLDAQDAAVERLRQRDFAGTLLGYVEQARAAPRRPRPDVAFDFWDQVRAADELEEIKQYRPSAYLALPVASGGGSREPGAGQTVPLPDARRPTPDARR
jgi:glycosyltransferase involved in cell wall biosynthesis